MKNQFSFPLLLILSFSTIIISANSQSPAHSPAFAPNPGKPSIISPAHSPKSPSPSQWRLKPLSPAMAPSSGHISPVPTASPVASPPAPVASPPAPVVSPVESPPASVVSPVPSPEAPAPVESIPSSSSTPAESPSEPFLSTASPPSGFSPEVAEAPIPLDDNSGSGLKFGLGGVVLGGLVICVVMSI